MGNHPAYEIIIIGGGSAGLTVAARLKRENLKIGVAVIEPSSHHYYQPLWTLVGAGVYPKEVTQKWEADVMPKGVTWIQERAESFDAKANLVRTQQGKTYQYDFLVVAAGIQLDWDKVVGLKEAVGTKGVCSIFDYRYVSSTWDAISHFKGGNAVFTFPNTPVKCAGAPQKIMYLAEHHFRKSGVRSQTHVTFVSASAGIFGVKKYADALTRVVHKRNINTRYKENLVEVRAASREAVFENVATKERTITAYDLLHVTPPMSCPDFLKKSDLISEAGWVDVNKHTLQHAKYLNVFSLGDASSLPTSKTAAAIRKQAPVLVSNLLKVRSGKPMIASYNGYTSCPLVTGYGSLILAEFDYDGKPQETFPWDQGKERLSMYLLKKHLLPRLYWHGMLKGRA